MKTTFKKSLIATSVLAGLYGTSTSHAITFDETTDFSDLGGVANTTNISNMGYTLVNGSLAQASLDFFDNFQILGLPIGIQTINLDISTFTGADSTDVQIFENGSDTFSYAQSFGVASNVMATYMTSAMFNGDLRFEITLQNEGGGSSTYSIGLPVAPIPIPGAALLFASGLGALGAAKARRKAKRRA